MSGTVYLVGAGPGDPGLMTQRSLELIARADVVVYDRLIPDAALDGARADAELIYVGKKPGAPTLTQDEITNLIVQRGVAGQSVVRLKGGDPFVFGRGGEEADALRKAGVTFEVVPGITAGIAATAYAGIPVTHRDRASAVAFVTAHEDPDKPESAIDWQALASFPGTLVFYMGVKQLPQLCAKLIAAGRPADQSAAVVERGTQPAQRTVSATLETLAAEVAAAEVKPPAITLVGPVAELRADLIWHELRPLSGKRVAVTRARSQASGIASELRELGAAVLETPVIRTAPLEFELPDLSSYDLVCFTSPNGVGVFFERLLRSGLDTRTLANTTVAAVGPGTARALRGIGIVADTVPSRSVAEGLLEELQSTGANHKRALVAQASGARDVLAVGLRERGIGVDVLTLYKTEPEPLDGETASNLTNCDYITFTSASTVQFLTDALGGTLELGDARAVSIGPITSDALREHNVQPAAEADPHTPDGLVAAIVADAAR